VEDFLLLTSATKPSLEHFTRCSFKGFLTSLIANSSRTFNARHGDRPKTPQVESLVWKYHVR
jgi:hypothetical protein